MFIRCIQMSVLLLRAISYSQPLSRGQILRKYVFIPYREPQNLVLRHPVPIRTLFFSTFRRTLLALRVDWRNLTPHFALLPERGNENIKYLFPRLRIESITTTITFVPIRLDWPQEYFNIFNNFYYIFYSMRGLLLGNGYIQPILVSGYQFQCNGLH